LLNRRRYCFLTARRGCQQANARQQPNLGDFFHYIKFVKLLKKRDNTISSPHGTYILRVNDVFLVIVVVMIFKKGKI
jgi:hypothetical protein